MAYGIYEHPAIDAAIEIYLKASYLYGDPETVLTDRGAQFYTNARNKIKKGASKFEKFLTDRGMHHIVIRVNHPQINGKIERFYGNLQSQLHHFDSFASLIQ